MKTTSLLLCTLFSLALLGSACSDDSSAPPDGGKPDAKVVTGDLGPDLGVTLDCEYPKKYYPDQDGDGRGDVGHKGIESCDPLNGYVDNNLDCGDGDPNAFPGQKEYFTTPIKGDTANPWDYNCDGLVETKASYPAETCKDKGYTLCNSTDVPLSWHGTKAPACGVENQLIDGCTDFGDALHPDCRPDFAGSETQACR